MKVMLIQPPLTIDVHSGFQLMPPLGLAYLAAVLERENCEIKILDVLAMGLNHIEMKGDFKRIGLSEDDIRRRLKEFEPHVVGISAMFSAYAQDAHDMANLAKEVCPRAVVALGGIHASTDPSGMLENKNIDVVVVGEGELTLLELIRKLKQKGDIQNIAGTVTKKDGQIFVNPERPLIEDLDSMPFPARHLLPMEVYSQYTSHRYTMRRPLAQMFSSRGCPRNCVFCAVHNLFGKKWRMRDPLKVVDEIEHLVKNYGIREIHFNDDNISLNKQRLAEICDEIVRRKLDIRWTTPNGIAVWTLDRQLLGKMKKSGCYRLTFGIESGSPETQKFIGKNIDLAHAKEVIRHANRIGLWTVSTFIIGFPYETPSAIEKTIDYAIGSDVDFALFFLLRIYPGTRVYSIFSDEKLIKEGSNVCDTKFLTQAELLHWQKTAYHRFSTHRLYSLVNPVRVVRKVHSIEDFKYVLRLGVTALKLRYDQRKAYGKTSLSQVLYE